MLMIGPLEVDVRDKCYSLLLLHFFAFFPSNHCVLLVDNSAHLHTQSMGTRTHKPERQISEHRWQSYLYSIGMSVRFIGDSLEGLISGGG